MIWNKNSRNSILIKKIKYFWKLLVYLTENQFTLKYIQHIIIFFTGALLVLSSCSTDKDVFINKAYHGLNAHYNGYWNAKEIIKETVSTFEDGYVENYDDIIPVFMYPNNEESKNFKSPMDTSIKKCEFVINEHQMPKKKIGQYRKTEWNKWIDDNWFVVGKSQFYKREYKKAMEKFIFIEKVYLSQPIIFEAKLWQAKVYIERENFIMAQTTLDELSAIQEDQKELEEEEKEKAAKAKAKKKKSKARSNSKSRSKSKKKSNKKEIIPAKFPDKLNADIWPVYADLYLRKGEWDKAKEALKKSIELTKDRQFKTRLIFILAQLNHKKGGTDASDLYAEVVKRNPKYDMAFNAKINKAISFSGTDKKGIKSELRKMLKDEKNKDYFDQIYYTLANIEIAENDINAGINDLETSIKYSTSNPSQKSKSFLRLGKLYYQEKQYIKAQKYYDSTLTVLDEKHPDYTLIKRQNQSLTELVDNLNLAEKQDSLLMLCSLSDSELDNKILSFIQEEEQKIRALADLESQKALESVAIIGDGNGKFWTHNSKIRTKGFQDFKEQWGPRPNEDNWRRSERMSFLEEDENESEDEEVKNPKLTSAYYKKDLPCGDDKKMNAAKEDVVTGLYNAANVYRLQLEDNDASIKTFKRLDQYLPHKKSIEALYQLYVINGIIDNKSEETVYKNRILNEFPDSEYAKLINNPNYLDDLRDASKSEEKYYEEVYDLYTQKKYTDAIKSIDKRLVVQDNPILCKYHYLKAMAASKSNTNNLKVVEAALDDLVKNCDDELMVKQAVKTLDKLRNKQSVIDAQSGGAKYVYNADAKHYFVLVFPNSGGSLNKAKNKISNLNIAAFSTKTLTLKATFIDADNQIITVKSFKNKAEAMDYYTTFKVNKKEVKSLNKKFQYFVITSQNFSTFFVDKDFDEYQTFFDDNYIKK